MARSHYSCNRFTSFIGFLRVSTEVIGISQSEFRITWVEQPGPDTNSGQKAVSAATEPIELVHIKVRCFCRRITDEKH